jgi:AcrR family transcriptional regulator
MAQYQKEEVREAILKTAKSEFLRKGFRDANLREISKKARVPIGNLYNYFKDKDQLFREVLRPQMDAIQSALRAGRMRSPATDSGGACVDEQAWPRADDVGQGVGYLIAHRAELDLLVNKARGSSLEDFLEQVANDYQRACIEYFEDLAARNPVRSFKRPSEFFLHSLSHFYIKSVAEMLDHDLSDAELRDQVEELLCFTRKGLNA